jgi:hypothetical protein
MTVRCLISFRSDLADDGVETEDGRDFLEWPGRLHIQVAAEILEALGGRISEIIDMQELGWDLEAKLGRKAIWMRVEFVENEIIFMIEDKNPERTWYFARKPPGSVFTGMLTALDAALRADGRFHDFRWFTDKEYDHDAPGAPTPVSDVEEMAGYVPPPPPPPTPPRPWREREHPWRQE